MWRKSWKGRPRNPWLDRVNKILTKKAVRALKNKMQSMNQCGDIVEERMICKSGMEK